MITTDTTAHELADQWAAIKRLAADLAAIIKAIDPGDPAAAIVGSLAEDLDQDEPHGHIAEVLDHLADATEAIARKLGADEMANTE